MKGKLSDYEKLSILLAAGASAAVLASGLARRMRRMIFKGASVAIAGGSRGLGLELARIFGKEGARLTLLARNEEELQRARLDLYEDGIEALVRTCDVTKRQQVNAAVDFILKERGRIDVLVNVAGVIQVGPLENQDLEDFTGAMDVHAWGPLYLMMATVPHMKKQGGGRIVNISSIGGLVSIPHMVPYSMSKFALTGLSDGVRAEMAKDNILVTTVAPGLMRTGSHMNAYFKGQNRKEFAWFSVSAASPLLSARTQVAARKIVEACRRGDPQLIVTTPAKILHAANALFPNLVASWMKIAARLLPAPDAEEHRRYTGWESRSPAAPSLRTRAAGSSMERNTRI